MHFVPAGGVVLELHFSYMGNLEPDEYLQELKHQREAILSLLFKLILTFNIIVCMKKEM